MSCVPGGKTLNRTTNNFFWMIHLTIWKNLNAADALLTKSYILRANNKQTMLLCDILLLPYSLALLNNLTQPHLIVKALISLLFYYKLALIRLFTQANKSWIGNKIEREKLRYVTLNCSCPKPAYVILYDSY